MLGDFYCSTFPKSTDSKKSANPVCHFLNELMKKTDIPSFKSHTKTVGRLPCAIRKSMQPSHTYMEGSNPTKPKYTSKRQQLGMGDQLRTLIRGSVLESFN